jgi:hypothetical protein
MHGLPSTFPCTFVCIHSTVASLLHRTPVKVTIVFCAVYMHSRNRQLSRVGTKFNAWNVTNLNVLSLSRLRRAQLIDLYRTRVQGHS